MTPPGPIAGRTVVVLAAFAVGLGVLAAPAMAAPGSGPSAVVSIGDSYISGEAGRWAGNSTNPVLGHDRTDRACRPGGALCVPDRNRVYLGGSAGNRCHRSDVAEVLSSQIAVAELVNIACSGAETVNVFRGTSGGVAYKGEPTQADQLRPIAETRDVKMIVVSIGGNDLGFASAVVACVQAYLVQTGPCRTRQQAMIDRQLPQAQAGVEKAFDEIRAVMTAAGYAQSDYRLVAQTYPSVVPRASEARYPQAGLARTLNGCPLYDTDLTWAREQAAPQIGSMVKAAAAAKGVEVMDLRDALQGHEFCSVSARQATLTFKPPAAASEWGRFVTASTVLQGDLEEAFHPNAHAQRALGDCLAQVYGQEPGAFACAGAAGGDVDAMALTRTSVAARPVAPANGRPSPLRTLRVSSRRRAGTRGRTCVTFRVTSRGRAVRGAVVAFGGRRVRTVRNGSATVCRRLRPGRHRAVVTRAGYRTVRLTLRAAARRAAR